MFKKDIVRFTACCISGLFLFGCADSRTAATESAEETTMVPTSQAPHAPASDETQDPLLPEYVCTEDDPLLQGICEYLVSEHGNTDMMDGNVYIPVPVILKTEESGQEVLVYGVFWDFWYEQKGDTLFCTRGGANTGRIRMIREGTSLTVSEFEKVRDGGDFIVDLKQLCGEDTRLYDTFLTKETREDLREQRRIHIISQYVSDNGLSVSSYQDSGWEPVGLTPQTDDPAL